MLSPDIYKIFNLAEFEDAHERPLQPEELDTIISNLSNLESELNKLLPRFRDVARNNVEEIYYLDFDVIYSAINWIGPLAKEESFVSRDSFWSSLAINLLSTKMYVLPGTVFEIVQFARKQTALQRKIESSQIAEVFLHEFQNKSEFSKSRTFLDTVNTLKRIQFGEKTYFILNKIFSQNAIFHHFYKGYQFDRDIFQSAYTYLRSISSRRDQYINNRVDAMNFAICAYYNELDHQRHHTIVSNSKSLLNLPAPAVSSDNVSSLFYSEGNHVSTARQACIYHLIRRISEDDNNAAELICRTWIKNVNLVKYKISELVSSSSDRSVFSNEIVNNDQLIDTMWMFESLQKEFSNLRHKQRRELHAFRKTYQFSDHKKFMIDISDNIFSSIKNTKYYNIIMNNKLTDEKAEISEFTISTETGLQKAFEIFSKEQAVNITGGESGFRIWGRVEMPMKKFIDDVTHTSRNIRHKFYNDIYSLEGLTSEDAEVFFQDASWHFLSREGCAITSHLPMGDLPDFKKVVAKLNLTANDSLYCRFDSPIFSVSYDGVMAGALTQTQVEFDLRDMFDNFLGLSFPLRSTAADTTITKCSDASNLVFLSHVPAQH
ncbi:hypothetical protein [uncultured Roseibium sp.]|uniref:hypothetical protein n=1 Tax=uncultured Roseibium sp. TaxID=1936171 RepID=UPI0032168C92